MRFQRWIPDLTRNNQKPPTNPLRQIILSNVYLLRFTATAGTKFVEIFF